MKAYNYILSASGLAVWNVVGLKSCYLFGPQHDPQQESHKVLGLLSFLFTAACSSDLASEQSYTWQQICCKD